MHQTQFTITPNNQNPPIKITTLDQSHYLRERNNVIVIMAEATSAPYELPEHQIPKWVPPPPVGISALHPLRLLPALLLHAVREATRVGGVLFLQIIESLNVVRG